MQTTRRTLVATAVAALLGAIGVTAAIAADPAPAPPPRIAFLANGIVPADALAAGPIAGQLGAPIYTTRQETLSDAAATGLDGYDPELVIVLGGPVAISDDVIDQVETATGLTETDTATPAGGIVRAAGGDRFDTAAAVADLLAAYDPAYLPVDLQAVDADRLDGRDATDFLTRDGATTVSSLDWRNRTPDNFEVSRGATVIMVGDASTPDDRLTLNPQLPHRLGGTTTGLTGMELCVDSGGDRIQEVSLFVSEVAGDGSRTFPVEETMTWSQGNAGCQTYALDAPVALGADRLVGASLRIDTTGPWLPITKTAFFLQGQDAA